MVDNYDPSQFGNLPTEPTRDNQILHARRLLATEGREALRNPHAEIGKICGCGTCFCCAALFVLREDARRK